MTKKNMWTKMYKCSFIKQLLNDYDTCNMKLRYTVLTTSIVLQLTYIPFFYILVCDFHNILRNNLHDLHTWIISLIFLLKYWNFLVNKNLNNILLQFKKFVYPIYFFDILQMLFLFMYVLHVSFYWFEQNKLNWTTKYYGYLK